MNYRHIFHAGNICDVVKHSVLTLVLTHLHGKEAAFCVLDTHAGIGRYDLTDSAAVKTIEAQAGIQTLLTAPPLPELADFYAVLTTLNPGWQAGDNTPLRFYPGSPLLAAHLLRPQDRLIACELHPEDAKTLRYNLHPFPQAQAHHRDGYEALRAFLPPPEKRGLVLIDPPYEHPDELTKLPAAMAEAQRRWPQGIMMLWYPIKDRPLLWQFHEALAASGIPKILCAEFIYQAEIRADRLNGSGLIIINPPWRLDEKLGQLFPILHGALNNTHRGCVVKWLNNDNKK